MILGHCHWSMNMAACNGDQHCCRLSHDAEQHEHLTHVISSVSHEGHPPPAAEAGIGHLSWCLPRIAKKALISPQQSGLMLQSQACRTPYECCSIGSCRFCTRWLPFTSQTFWGAKALRLPSTWQKA